VISMTRGTSSRRQKLAWSALFLVLMTAVVLHAQQDPEVELRAGIELTKQGMLQQAIPHLAVARGHVREEYAASFNLGWCYAGVGEYGRALTILNELKANGADTADVENLLAQAYVGNAQPAQAFAALKQAAARTPKNEKLYIFVSDACTDHHQLELGLQIVELGLKSLPESARLHYERAMFLAQLDQYERAKPEFETAYQLAPATSIGYLAHVQENLFADKIGEALRLAREGIRSGESDPVLQALYGEVLLHSGVTPDQSEFAEARIALERAVAAWPNYSTAQISLGKLYLMEGRSKDAIKPLEIGLRMEPHNAAVYSSLAAAYRQAGQREQAKGMLEKLQVLLKQQDASKASATAQVP